MGGGWAPDDSSHVHHAPVGGVGAQLFPGSPATSTPQAFLVATWSTKASTSVSSRSNLKLDARCCPAHIHQIGAGFHAYGGSSTDSLALHLPALLAGPGSSGSADPSRRCQGCSHRPLRLQVRAAPCFVGLLRQPKGGSFHPTRLMAPHGARKSRTGARCRPFRTVVSPARSSEPDVRVSTHPALHEPMPPIYAASSVVLAAQGDGMRFPR
jgi:hypothetical protein